MNVHSITGKLKNVLYKNVGNVTEAIRKSASKNVYKTENATQAVASAAKKIPPYAAVKIDGIVIFMPATKIPKNAEILSKPLNSVNELLNDMNVHNNIIPLK